MLLKIIPKNENSQPVVFWSLMIAESFLLSENFARVTGVNNRQYFCEMKERGVEKGKRL